MIRGRLASSAASSSIRPRQWRVGEAPLRGRLPARRIRPGRTPAGDGRRAHRHRAPLPHRRDLLGGLGHRPALATAYTRAYNRYIVDFCSHDPVRLVPVAHLSLHRPGRRRRRSHARPRRRLRAVYLSPDRASRGGRAVRRPAFDRSGQRCRTSTCRSGSTSSCATAPMLSPWMPKRGAGRECSASRSSPST